MRQAIVRVLDRPHQRRRRSQIRRALWTRRPVTDRLSISHERQTGSGFLLVEDFVEQNDLSRNLIAPQAFSSSKLFTTTTSAVRPSAAVAVLPPSAVSTTFCVVPSTWPAYSTSSAVSAPRTQWGTFTSSSWTSSPSFSTRPQHSPPQPWPAPIRSVADRCFPSNAPPGDRRTRPPVQLI